MQDAGLSIPDKSINVAADPYTAGVYDTGICKGASLRAAGTDGILMVHPVKNGATDYYPLDLTAGGGPVGFMFDQIIEAGTTVTLSNVDIFPDVR
jgi:hypothetical protein